MYRFLQASQPIADKCRRVPMRLFWFALLATALWSSSVFGQSASSHIGRGKLLYNAQEYDKAVSSFRKATAAKDATNATRIEALKYLGLIAVILRKEKAARRYFLKLLNINPSFKLDDSHSPKLVKAFMKVKKEHERKSKVTIRNLTASKSPSEKPLELRIQLVDQMKRVSSVALWFKIEGSNTFTKRTMQEVSNPGWQASSYLPAPPKWQGGEQAFGHRISICAKAAPAAASGGKRFFSFSIPKFVGRTEAYDIEYYVVAYNAKQQALATVGSKQKPLISRRTVKIVKKAAPTSTPIYKKWWLWTIVGVGVAGGVAAIVIAATLPKAPPTPDTGGAVITVIKPQY